MNWIDKLVEQHLKVESPKNFWYWAAIATLSAVVKDNIWLDRGGLYKLYPNIYVMLHADSGLKKGPPVALAKNIVKRVNNTKIISGRSSIQGILKELGTGQSQPGGRVATKSIGFIVASEFSSSLVNDPAAMTILTDLYDRQYNEGEYRSLLKMESFQLRDPTITMLVATNEAHFQDFVARKDIQGGFIGRMFVIAESEVQTLNPLIRRLDNPPNADELAIYPKELSKITGEFKSLAETPAGDLYEDWYYKFYRTIKEQDYKDETGTVQRFGDSILKIAMLISLGTDFSLQISEEQMAEAINVGERLIGNIRRTTMSRRQDEDNAQVKAAIIKELLNREGNTITRAMLLRKQIMGLNADELDMIMLSFHEAGIITTKSIGNQIIYEMPEKQVDEYRKYLAGKRR
jgi:hypothetical protein